MNKIILQNQPEIKIQYKRGDIFNSGESYYILCERAYEHEGKFYLLSLNNGFIYDFSEELIKNKNIKFVGRDMEIVLKSPTKS